MYNTKFVCTYNIYEVFFESDDITENDKEFIRDAIYRQELLNIIGMDDYNEKEMERVIIELYERVKENNELKRCMVKLASNFMSIDETFGLLLMFAYDYMHISHICISEFLENGKISEKNIEKLKSNIF